MSDTNSIGAIIRKAETDYQTGDTTISEYVEFDLQENLARIDAYANSKHTSGDVDSKGRDKPFYNIVTSAINTWYRATDIDRSQIKVRATKLEDTIKALVATHKLQEWMRKVKFGSFLNQWGRSLAKNGSSVLKFVEKDGQLIPMVMPWQTLIIDAIDFESNPVIEILYLTPAQLRMREGYDKKVVEALITSTEARETSDNIDKDEKADFIKLYEIHGNMSKALLTGDEEDETTYVQQMQVVSFVEGKNRGEFDDFVLASGKEKNPYMITHLIKEEGRSQSIGAVEHLFEAQWMNNHAMKALKDELDLGKTVFQTADPNFVGQNATDAIDTGDILVHAQGQELTKINNSAQDVAALQAFGAAWKAIGMENTGVSEAMLGSTPKSGTAWRQTEAILQESHDLFELMTENKGLHITDMLTDYVIPYIKRTQLSNKDEIVATLESHDIKMIDAEFIAIDTEKHVKEDVKESLLRGELPVDLNVDATEEGIKQALNKQGNTRSFVPSDIGATEWKEYFKDLEWDLEIDVTGEGKNVQEAMTTINTVLQITAANPQAINDPLFRTLLNKALNLTGAISPLELAQIESTPPAPPTDVPRETAPEATI